MIKCDNIFLQPLTIAFAKQVFALFSKPKVIECYDSPPIESGETEMVFTYRIIKGSNAIWQISLTKKPQQLIGICALHNYNANSKTIEIGSTLLPNYWNKNIMSTALQYIIKFSIHNYALKKIIAKTSPSNIQAIRLVSKLGFVKSKQSINQIELELNIDKNTIVKQAANHLKNGEVILCPTDTIWGLSCNALMPNAIEKIDTIKKRPATKSYIVLINNFETLSKYVRVNETQIKALLNKNKKPITIIYSLKNSLLQHLAHSDNTLAIRIPKLGFMPELLKEIGFPIVSTSANINGETAPVIFNDISSLVRNEVDYIVPTIMDSGGGAKASTIIKLNDDGSINTIRE